MAGTILTNIGLSKLAAATPQNQLNITHIAVGDGNGGFPTLSPAMTALTNEVWRGDASNPIKDGSNSTYVYFETNIPPEVGPFDVREIACFDIDGDMIAIGHTSLIQKPSPAADANFAVAVKIFIALENATDFDLIYQNTEVTSHNGLSGRNESGAHTASSVNLDNGDSLQVFIDKIEYVTKIDVDWFDGDLIAAIHASNGKPIQVNSDIIVNTALDSFNGDVILVGSGKVTFKTPLFLSNFGGSFMCSGVHLHSESQCVVTSFATNSKIDYFILRNLTKVSGACRFLYNSDRTLNPYETEYGIGVVYVNNIDTEDTLEGVFLFDNTPCKYTYLCNNRIKNFRKAFYSSALTNSHPYIKEVQIFNALTVFCYNTVINDDDWWSTAAGDVVTYGALMLHEGNKLIYSNNDIDGIKARAQAGNPSLSESTAYWLYIGGLTTEIHYNTIKNVFSFGSASVPAVAFKLKQGRDVNATCNKFKYDDDWLTRIGASVSDTNDAQLIHDSESGFNHGDVHFENNTIELIANGKTQFVNVEKYKFIGNSVSKGSTNLSDITIHQPIPTYTDTTADSDIIYQCNDNFFKNEGGNITGSFVRSTRATPFTSSVEIDSSRNKYNCATLVNLCRVSGYEGYNVDINDNTIRCTGSASVFGTGENSGGVSVKGEGNKLIGIPLSLEGMKGFGAMPLCSQSNLSMKITSEGSVSELLVIDGESEGDNLSYVVSGDMFTSQGKESFQFIFKVTGGSGYKTVDFLDADGLTSRTFASNISNNAFCNQSILGTRTRLNISTSSSNNKISIALSESIEGDVADNSVDYHVNVYGV